MFRSHIKLLQEKAKQNNIATGNNFAFVVKTKLHCADSISNKGFVASADGNAVGSRFQLSASPRLFDTNIDSSTK